MKLNFKDLKQQSFSVDAEPTDTIATVKAKVAEAKGLEAAQMRLIFSGKILADDNTVESYNVEQMLKGYIVCMVQKPKQTIASTSKVPSTPAAPIVAQTPAAPAPATPSPASAAALPSTPTPAPANTSSAAAGSRQFNDPSPLMLGGERQAALANMEAMGFPRAECERALRAAFFNPDRAVEYLLTGIPENAQQRPSAGAQTPTSPAQTPAAAPPTATSAAPATTGEADDPVNLFDIAAAANQGGGRAGGGARGAPAAQGAPTGLEAGEGQNLDFLRDNPTFQHLRQLVQQQPAMLENVLQQVGASNPQLAQLIASNPQQFMQLLAESDDGEGVPLPPGAQNISVTPEERDAIERLCRLGFERDLVIQAYFACDKNEELAANFLFDHPDDIDEQ